MYGRDDVHAAVLRLLAHLSSGSPLPGSARGAARLVGVSHSHLHHLLKQQLGRTYLGLVRETRVQRARHLLESSPQWSISEVAEAAGYTTRSMCRDFVRTLGMTPSQMRTRVPVVRADTTPIPAARSVLSTRSSARPKR